MYFIARGTIKISIPTDNAVNFLSEGSYFGEICLLTDDRRTATATAVTACDLCTLKKLDFDQLMEEFPEAKNEFEILAIKRLSKIGLENPPYALRREGKLYTSIAPPNILNKKKN